MFSPTPRPTPRKSVYRGRQDTASVSRGTPSVISEREPLTPARSSRLTTLKRAASPTSTAGDLVRTTRYDEGSDRIYWAKNDRCAVYALGGLPREVQQLVKNSDLVTSPLGGHIDAASGYAYVTTPTMCIAWNYSKRTQSSPTVYTFPAPSASHTSRQSLPPVIAALHYTGAGEPGVILVSTTGEIRYWDSMSLALSNVDRYQSLQLDLGEDYADKVWSVDQNTFIITTYSSLAFRLSITSHSGRQTPSVTPLMRPGGMFGRASSSIFSLREDREGISAVTAEGSNAWILARRTVQKWQLGNDGLKYILDADLHDMIGNELFPGSWSNGDIELELNDLSPVYPNQLAVLISYTEQTGSSAPRSAGVSHAIVILGSSGRGGGLVVKRVIHISYSAPADARTLDVPRLIIPFDSSTAYIRFASTVLMVSLDTEAGNYEEVITLKDPLRNAFIGSGHLASPVMRSPSPPFILMPALGGLLGVEAFTPPISTQIPSSLATATFRLKSKMEQAVFFGDRWDNPLSFYVPSNVGGDVAVAAEAVSTEILSCTSPYMPAIYELRPQLADRLNRLKELIRYIRRNGLLNRLPQDSRRLLSRDGEKAKAAVDLWDYQNRLMDQMHTQSPKSLLSDSIIAFMDQFGAEEDDDRIRLFFRTQAQHLDRLLKLVFATFRNTIGESADSRGDRSAWILEANKVFIIIVRAAAQYQEDELPIYEIDRVSPSVEQWTAQTPIMDALETLYSMTEQLIADRTRDLGSAIDTAPTPSDTADMKAQRQMQYLLKNQMAEIAAALCANMEDKLRATSRRHITEGGEEEEGISLKRKWEEMRPRVIRPLVLIDRVSHAYELAEHHNDYETLVWLCHDQVAGAGTVKLQEYIERFGEEFAFVLYQWYIDQGQQHALLSQDEVYGGLVTKFFEMRDYPELAWLHHLACKRYGAAATCLAVVDSRETALDAKHIMSSIGKLTAVAEMRANGVSDQRRKRLIEFDDELDIIQVQEQLRSSLISTASTRRTTISAVDDYLSKNITLLGSRPAFYDLVADLARGLADGDALDIEGLVDVLTLKNNRADGEGDPAIALDRLAKDTTLPEGRKQVALLSVWRRVYIRDDWISISNTAGKSEEKIQQLLRQTLAYTTIKAVGNLSGFPQSFVLSPYTSSQPPLLTELTARFPDRLPEEIEALMADHQDEIRVLEMYMDEAGLEARVKEVAELVKREMCVGEGERGDVQMR